MPKIQSAQRQRCRAKEQNYLSYSVTRHARNLKQNLNVRNVVIRRQSGLAALLWIADTSVVGQFGLGCRNHLQKPQS